MLIWNYKM